MKTILDNLNLEVGIKGSLILAPDGMVIVSAIQKGLNGEVVAAVISTMLKDISGSLEPIGGKTFRRSYLTGTFGRIIIMESGSTYIAVVLDQHIEEKMALLAIQSASRKIRHMGDMAF